MRKLAVPAAISLLVLIVALVFFFMSTDGGLDSPYSAQPERVDVADDLDEVRDVDLSGRTQIAPENPDEELVSPAAEGATLSGMVGDAFGDPIAGAVVFLRTDTDDFRGRGDFSSVIRDRILNRGTVTRQESGAVVETTTDDQGRYLFPLASIPRGTYRVYARHDEYAATYERWEWTPESSVVDFRLALGASITGVVVDRSDRPIAGAVVEAHPDGDRGRGFRGRGRGPGGSRSLADKTTTDSRGFFRLSLPSGTYRISADSETHSPDSVGDVATGTQDVVVVLDASKSLAGAVVDDSQRPISGAVVALYSSSRFGRGDRGRGGRGGRGGPGSRGGRPDFTRLFSSPRAEVVTDGNGQFRFSDVPAEGYSLMAEKSGYVTAQVSGSLDEESQADPAADPSSVTVVLQDAAVLGGLVKSRDGTAVAGAFVSVASDRGDDENRFGRRGFGPGGRGFGRGGRGRGDRGFGRGDRGDPRPEESEQVAEPRPPEPVSVFSLVDGAETDGSGRFTFDKLPPGRYSLSVESERHPVYREDAIELEKDDPRRVDIVLEKGITLRGKVVSDQGGDPVPNARLNLRVTDRQRRTVETNEDGEYEVAGLIATNLSEVRIEAPGYTDGFFEDVEVLEKPSTQERDFNLRPGASVAGTVTDTSGNAINDARVSLTPAIDVEIESSGGFDGFDFSDMRSTFRRTFSQSERTKTNVDGQYVFEEVGGGLSFRVEVEHPDYRRLTSDVISVEPGENLVGVDLQLKMGARIEVLVLDSGGLALPRARVSIERQRTPVELQAAVEERRQQMEQERATRSERGPQDRESEQARRRGRDVREMVQRIVSRGEEDAVRRSRSTGPDGKAIFSGMSGGVYLVRVSAGGHQNYYGQVTAVEDTSVTVSADLLAENVISGIVQDRFGEPVPGAEVEASRIRTNPAAASVQVEEDSSDPRMRFRDRSRLREEENDRTDESGRFSVGQLADGLYDLRIRARGFSELRLSDVPVNREQTILLQRLGSVAGTVVVNETGLPITAFRARLVAETSPPQEQNPGGEDPQGRRRFGRGGRDFGDFMRRRGERWRSFNDPVGAFLLEDINPGRYSLEVIADGFAGNSVPVTVEDGIVTNGVQVSLAEGLSITGTVVHKGTSEAIAAARIYLVDMTPQQQDEGETRRRRTPSGSRGDDGPAENRGRRTRASRRTAVEEAQLAFSTLEAARKTAGGSPLASTDETGYFKLLEVTVGRYMLVVDHDQYVPARKEIRIDDDRVLPETRIDLDPGSTLKGKITLPDGESNVGVTVVVQSAEGYSRRAETDTAGRYTVTGLIPGDYSLSVRGVGGLVVKGQKVEVEDGNNTFDYRPEK